MLSITCAEEGGTGQQVGDVAQLQQRGQRCLPASHLGAAGLHRRPPVGTPQGVGRGRQLGDRAGADVLADDTPGQFP